MFLKSQPQMIGLVAYLLNFPVVPKVVFAANLRLDAEKDERTTRSNHLFHSSWSLIAEDMLCILNILSSSALVFCGSKFNPISLRHRYIIAVNLVAQVQLFRCVAHRVNGRARA
jgi:hypothetical protein